MNDDTQRQYREVQAHFRLPSVALVEKDVHVVRAIQALTAIDATPFTLVFGGGTALARAYRIIRRMSEDVDFKIVPPATATVSRSVLRQQLGALRAKVTDALLAAGFTFDPADPACTKSRNENRYQMAEERMHPSQIKGCCLALRRSGFKLPRHGRMRPTPRWSLAWTLPE